MSLATTPQPRLPLGVILIAALLLIAPGLSPVQAQDLRVVTWNTANDVNGTTDFSPRSGASDILQAIGAENVAGIARPIDVLALQESVYHTGSTPNPTAQGFANLLNALYGTSANPTPYAVAPLNGATDGNNIGNGPQSLVYNTNTLSLVFERGIGNPSGSTFPRQILEYEFQPVGAPASDSFYLFSDHFKSGTGTTNLNNRGREGTLLASTANALPANSSIIYAGDYNATSNANDPGYKAVITPGSHNNQGIDPLAGNFTSLNTQTESPTTTAKFTNQSTVGMRFRDDLLLNSPAIADGTGPLSYVNGSLLAFGNTGTHRNGASITTGSAAALAAELPGYTVAQASALLTDLTQVSDHLPVVADYHLNAVPEPSSIALAGLGAILGLALNRRRRDWSVPNSETPRAVE